MSFFDALRKLVVRPGDVDSLAPSDIPDIVDGTIRTLRTGNNYMYPPNQLLAALMTIYKVQGGCRGYSDMLVRMDDLSLINPSVKYGSLWSNVVAKSEPLDIFRLMPTSSSAPRKKRARSSKASAIASSSTHSIPIQPKNNLAHRDMEPPLRRYREENKSKDEGFEWGLSKKKVKKIAARQQPERECRFSKRYPL